MLDPQKIKRDFPILARTMSGRPLVYLDNAATTQKPAAVIDAVSEFYRTSNANIHRGVYQLAEEATNAYEDARKKVAAFINAPAAEEVVFTRGTTESINLIASSWGRKHLKPGDEILLTDMEHHANIVPWYLLAKEKGLRLVSVKLDDRGRLDMADFEAKLSPRVKLVAVTAVSNVLGTINPIEAIVAKSHAAGALVAVDGAQSTPHLPTDVQNLGCDFFSFSAHKMLGPTGVGVLWAPRRILETMAPYQGGGEMISMVALDNITWADLPLKFEAGTSNFADAAAFGPALDYLTRIGLDAVRRHEKKITAYALERLAAVSDLVIYGPKNPDEQGGVVSFNHTVVHAHDVGTILSEQGVAVRVGHHCAQPLMKAIGAPATVRASFYIYNDEADVDRLVEALAKVNDVFGIKA